MSNIVTQQGIRNFLAQLLPAKVLLMKTTDSSVSSRFDLSGLVAAVGPASAFAKQCLR